MKLSIERVDQAEADVTVRYPTGRMDVIKGGTYTEWQIVEWDEDDTDAPGRVVACCHSAETAEKIKQILWRASEGYTNRGLTLEGNP